MSTTLAGPRARDAAGPAARHPGPVEQPSERRLAWRTLKVVTALHLALLVTYSLLVPAFRAPDEYVHVDLARTVALDRTYPDYDERFVAAPVIAARDTSRAYDAFAPAVDDDGVTVRGRRPAFADLGPDTPTAAVNPLPQHPPLYYVLGAGVYELAGDDVPFDRHVWLLRLLSVALVAPLPLLAWATARRLGARPPVALASAVLLVAVPAFTHIGSSVNNDNLLVLLGGLLTLLLVRAVTGDASHRTALLGGLVVGLALLTKGFALVLLPWAVAAYALARSLSWRARVARAAELAVVAMATGGWWWVRNVAVHGRVQPSVGERPPAPEPVDADVVEFARGFAGRVFGSFWGSFGWREADSPWPAVLVPTVVVVAAVVAAFVLHRRARDRVLSAFLLFPTAVLFAGVAANAWRAYLKTGTPFASQGRYLYAGLVALAVVVATGLAAAARGRSQVVPVALAGAAVVLHALAAVAIVTRYWAGDGAIERVQALLAFSPVSPAVAGAAAGAAVALAAWAMAECWRYARSGG